MSQHGIVYQWARELARRMPQLSKPQVVNLALWTLGLSLARRCTVRIVAEALWWVAKADSVERRLQRFVVNESVSWEQGSRALARWVLRSMAPSEGLVVLLVDETSLGERLKVMAVGLAYRGRALPLAWWCYRQDRWPMGQRALILSLLDRIAPSLPPGATVLVEADRGIGNSPDLLRAIQRRGWYFLVRVSSQVRLVLEDGREETFGELLAADLRRWKGPVSAFKKAGWLSCWAVGVWKEGQQEPWLLLTNYPPAQGTWYGLRMWKELAFKDFKSNGWQWQRSHIWDPDHANRLWLIMALAYLWMVLLGTSVADCPTLRAQFSRGRQLRHSVLQLGLRYLHRFRGGLPESSYHGTLSLVSLL